MSDKNQGYKDWQWLEMDMLEQARVERFKTLFNKAASAAGAEGYEFDIKKASLTIDSEEARSGAFHKLAGGEPFYRLSITAPADGTQEGFMAFMFLGQAFAVAGGVNVSMGSRPEITFDRREMTATADEATRLFAEAITLIRKQR